MEKQLLDAVREAVKALYGEQAANAELSLQKTRKEYVGDLTLVVFPLLKMSRKKPADTAEEIGKKLMEICPLVAECNAVGGFLNIKLSDTAWLSELAEIDAAENFGFTVVSENSPLIMVEYSSPNTNKPLHLGHIRNNLLGYSLAKILEANGNKVVKTNIVNDRGIHICKSMVAWKRFAGGATPESTGIKGDHLVGDYYVAFDKEYKKEIAALVAEGKSEEEAKEAAPIMQEAREMLRLWEAGDAATRELWATMNQWVYDGFDETYKRLGVSFDKIYYESQTYLVGKQKVLEGLEKGLFFKKDDGSVWADFTKEGLDEKLLLRADGTSVYMTQDIGTATLRFSDYKIDKMIYVVGNEQNYHFQVLSLLLDRLGFKWGKDLVHFSYGMVELPEGKMKSREGTVVDADDLMDEMVATATAISKELGKDGLSEEETAEVCRKVGLGSLKYFILKVDPRKNMTFNPKESIDFNGNTGSFIQYAYARICSVLRKAAEQGIATTTLSKDIALSDAEIELVQQLSTFPAVVRQAGEEYSPSLIANYSYDLVKNYNRFYHDFSILKEENTDVRAFRLQLSRNVAKILRQAMSLLGIELPERM